MKKTSEKTAEITNQNNQETAVILDQTTQEAITKATEKAEQLPEINKITELKRTKNIVPQYFEFEEEGQILRAFFLGTDTVTMNDRANAGEKKLVRTAFFSNPEGNFICSSVSLVRYLEQYGTQGEPYEIVYLGEEKTSKGNKVKTFDIFLLG